jgi:hypothetical protein
VKIIEVPLTVLRFQYQVARFPLQLIEDRVVARLDAEAPARLFYERSFGGLDAAVGNLLGDSELQKRGAALADRSDALGRAARLEAAAKQKKEKADADLESKRNKVIEDQQEAHAAKKQEVKETLAEAEERKRNADEAAAKQTAAAKKQADQLAAQRTASAEAAKRDEQAKIAAEERKATAAAKAKLDAAKAKQSEADSKRAQADRVEELADVEKQNRQAARANNA